MKYWFILYAFSFLMMFTSSKMNLNSIDNPKIESHKYPDYSKEWKKISALEAEGKPQSAKAEALKLLERAKKEKNYPQQVKAIIHIMRNVDQVEEESELKNLAFLEQQLKTASEPVKSILFSMQAGAISNYYTHYSYIINQRTNVAGKGESIEKWDRDDFRDTILKCFQASVQQKKLLLQIPIRDYTAIMDTFQNSDAYRPTLYDQLAFRALNFYRLANSTFNLVDDTKIESLITFTPIEDFISLELKSKLSLDSTNFVIQSLQLYQEMLRFHKNDEQAYSLIHIDLSRLEYASEITDNDKKEEAYYTALQALERKYAGSPAVIEVVQQRANMILGGYIPKGFPKKQSAAAYSLKIIDSTLNLFPKALGIDILKLTKSRILFKNVGFAIEYYQMPNQPIKVMVTWQNIEQVYYRIYAVSEAESVQLNQLPLNERNNALLKREIYKEGNIALFDNKDYDEHSSDIALPELKVGKYFILVNSNENFSSKNGKILMKEILVSNIRLVQIKKTGDSLQTLYLLNATSGEPLVNANVRVLTKDIRKKVIKEEVISSGVTDKEGKVAIKTIENWSYTKIEVSTKEETVNFNEFYLYKSPESPLQKQIEGNIYTDRGIYRPGQTVYFKGLLYEVTNHANKNTYEIAAHKKVKVKFYDVNSQEISSRELTTNAFGSYSSSFIIPSGLLNGVFDIMDDYGNRHSISVEEYKRPMFEVLIDTVKGDYKLNEEVKVTGNVKTYTGIALPNAEVRFRVVRNIRFIDWRWGRFLPNSSETEIEHGIGKTDENGNFSFEFNAKPDSKYIGNFSTIFNFTVHVDVTDITGETQSNTMNVNVGTVALEAKINISDWINKEVSTVYSIEVKNLSDVLIKKEGVFILESLKAPERVFRKRVLPTTDTQLITKTEYGKLFPHDAYRDEEDVQNYDVNELLLKKTVIANEKLTLSKKNLRKMPQGWYRARFETTDNYGKKVETVSFIKIYDPKATKPAITAYLYLIPFNITNIQPNKTASFLMGSAEENSKVRLIANHNGMIILDKWYTLNKKQEVISIPITEEMRGSVYVEAFTYRDNRYISEKLTIEIPYLPTNLNIIPGTFRSSLKPGQKETWRFKIKGPNAELVNAEMMATLYDASLDVFNKNEWNFSLPRRNFNGISIFNTSENAYSAIGFENAWNKSINYHYQQYDKFIFEDYYRYPLMFRGNMSFKAGWYKETVVMDALANQEDSYAMPAPKMKNKDANSKEQDKPNNNQSRKNLNELAFFYPQLQTDDSGSVTLEFTMPEALTRWRFMALAHNKGLFSGHFDADIVTQKEVMVQPYMPRFVRRGDSMLLSAKVTNMSNKTLDLQLDAQFQDAVTGKNINKLLFAKQLEQKIKLLKAESKNISISIVVPKDLEAIQYTISATSASYFDGEEGIIPVLPNRTLVTESKALYIRDIGTKNFTFEKLKNMKSDNTLTPYRLKVEMTSNPIWYAVQSMPYLLESPYDCSEQIFQRYYANALSQHLIKSNAAIKKVFELWKKQGNDALISNLEKNQDIKNILLQETPWVMEAKSETERKQRLSMLFDENMVDASLSQALAKLEQMQFNDNGWPWFKGMNSNRYITQYIVGGIGHLKTMGVQTKFEDRVQKLAVSAIGYMDDQMLKEYNYMKQHKYKMSDNHLSSIIISYLYSRSYFDQALAKPYTEAYNYWLSQANKYGLQRSLMEKAMLVTTYYRIGQKPSAQKILTSLEEFALQSEEMGMYWKENKMAYYWNHNNIATQSMLIEAFDLAGKKDKVQAMQVWLLKQKQTSHWGTTIATADAIYALLLGNQNQLQSNDIVKVSLGGKEVPTQSKNENSTQAGTGYYTYSYSTDAIQPEMGNISVTKADKGIAWGAVYFQYFQDLDKIETAEGELKLKRTLYKKKITDKGFVLEPITANTFLKNGDIVTVRLDIKTDRNMEYVHLKDQRASALEPTQNLSGFTYEGGLGYYQSMKDASMNFFFDYLNKGYYTLEYDLRVSRAGNFSNGYALIQNMYAPEFSAHSEGKRISIKDK